MIRHSYHGQRLLPALVETTGQRAYFSVEKCCWRLFNLASLNISEKVKFAKFAKYKGFTVVIDFVFSLALNSKVTGTHNYKLGKSCITLHFVT